jgi:hypothetical protein
MARTGNIQEQCGGKTKFDTLEKASKSAATLNERGGKRCRAYKCKYCKKYHFGHETKGSKLSKSDTNIIPPFHYEPGVHKVDISQIKTNIR